ncbi:MAG: Flp family type IVb pilin [Bacillota bacterium]|nr:Flp family type IVb pilin [Bacillota bacterium]
MKPIMWDKLCEERESQGVIEYGLLFALILILGLMIIAGLGQEISSGIFGFLERLSGAAAV